MVSVLCGKRKKMFPETKWPMRGSFVLLENSGRNGFGGRHWHAEPSVRHNFSWYEIPQFFLFDAGCPVECSEIVSSEIGTSILNSCSLLQKRWGKRQEPMQLYQNGKHSQTSTNKSFILICLPLKVREVGFSPWQKLLHGSKWRQVCCSVASDKHSFWSSQKFKRQMCCAKKICKIILPGDHVLFYLTVRVHEEEKWTKQSTDEQLLYRLENACFSVKYLKKINVMFSFSLTKMWGRKMSKSMMKGEHLLFWPVCGVSHAVGFNDLSKWAPAPLAWAARHAGACVTHQLWTLVLCLAQAASSFHKEDVLPVCISQQSTQFF